MASSAQSEQIRRWRHAETAGAVLLDGFHAVKHALRFGARVSAVLAADRQAVLELAGELAPDLMWQLNRLVTQVPAEVLGDLVPRGHPTGVAALADRPDRRANLAALAAPARRAPLIVLENPRNLGNIGAVIRLAAGFGATGVVTTGDVDPWHPNVVRGSAGLHFGTTVERLGLEELPSGPVCVLDPAGVDIRGAGLPDDALLAFGSERHGISDRLRSRADLLLAIPMRPQVSSFNLATSVAMTLFHWMSRSVPDVGPAAGSSVAGRQVG